MSTLSATHGIMQAIFSNLFVTLPVPEKTPGLSEKTFIVTGANQGLGLEACKHLLRIGVGRLIMGVRSLDKGEAARKELLAESGRAPETIEVWQVDMASYASVEAFATRANGLARLDGVLANAGMMTTTFRRAEDGEATIVVNVVATYLLLVLLLPKLRASPAGRATFTVPNSSLHYMASTREIVPLSVKNDGKTIFERLADKSTSDMKDRYNVSKLLVVFATRAFDAHLQQRSGLQGGGRVIVNTPNPSYCKSQLLRDTDQTPPPDWMARTPEMGSRALVHGLLAGPETSGQFLNNCHVLAPASFVTNKTGAKIVAAFYEELIQKLDSIVPGVSKNI
ncbi:hypothetical protein SPBR_07584 [Sporothrix brasiliensis 5110]|uniref:Short-chain dehydrogenase/reductase family protein n=1 Tax=Sporothrix brasiliensis 5110 TaxID=1398154 RepID=A0A0C2FC66_9PEZI|nr:uncharacterized protein SPBR_07584 [Sporothrix brasiliensis 5110]KIH88703.1 hypothetical protein SPBR_07584 [Sporothrix brasiliensis 5110]